MKRLLLIALSVLCAVSLASCGKDDGGSGTSESTAIKGTSSTIGVGVNGVFTGGSAFMYTSRVHHFFLLCEGEAKNWNDALKKPHLEVGIHDGSILNDITAVKDMSKAIDINDPKFASVECPVSVRWCPGNGMRFVNKYSYTGAVNSYQFDSGSLMVAKGPMSGMFMIAFVGSGQDKDKNKWDCDWSYGGQFTHK